MHIQRCKNVQELTALALDWLGQRAEQGPTQRVFVPAGKTPELLYEQLNRSDLAWADRLTFVQVDDVATGEQRDVFKNFFRQRLRSRDSQMEFITEGRFEGADLAILGFGVNGHVAFHEPNYPDLFTDACVRLSQETRDSLGLSDRDWGVTYGVGAFLRCHSILLLVVGEAKRAAFEKFVRGERDFPSQALKTHADLTVLTTL
jgi:glucosamine-6-phosphate deaminase